MSVNSTTARDTLRKIEDLLRSGDVSDGVSRNGFMSTEVIVSHIFEYVSFWARCRVWAATMAALPEAPADPDFNWGLSPPEVVERRQREQEADCAAHDAETRTGEISV